MSHLEERNERVCLNCNAAIYGRYCHVCGQENVEPKESFWHLLTHLVYDVTHFDGKFFSTLKYLLFRPGFLATEYLRGRRASYLHPIRMYVFASAIFFVVFFSFIVKPEEVGEVVAEQGRNTLKEAKVALQDSIKLATDSAKRSGFIDAYGAIENISAAKKDEDSTVGKIKARPGKTTPNKPDTMTVKENGWNFKLYKDALPNTVAEYDSIQKGLPEAKRDGLLKRMVKKRSIQVKQKYHGDDAAFGKSFTEKFLHTIPQMMFVSLPFVALIMQLLYIRRRKQYFYVNHVIFIIYLYIAIFVSMLVYFGLAALWHATKFAPFDWLNTGVTIYIFLYGWLAMHNFYKQGYVKSFFKYFLLLFICLFLSVMLVSFFFFTSLMSA